MKNLRGLISLFFLCQCVLALSISSVASAQTLKQMLLMPGELTASHQKYEAECGSCHSDFDQSKQVALCVDCHEEIAADLNTKQGFHGLQTVIANMECRECHTDHKGREFDIVGLDTDTFDHELSNFPLKGQHTKLACTSCHKPSQSKDTGLELLSYRFDESRCDSCHKDQSPHGENLPFAVESSSIETSREDCGACHSSEQWKKVSFDHSETDFPLRDSHKSVACESCHVSDDYKQAETSCYSCHGVEDAHQQRFGQKCESCHKEKEWQDGVFDHDKKTDFPLRFKHLETRCESCHQQAVNVEVPDAECVACHREDDTHNGSRGDECKNCHTPRRWTTSVFDHNKDTDFSLSGKHQEAGCNACHNKQKENKTAGTECVDCHKLADPHKKSLGEDCQLCHSTQSWDKSLFSHDLVDFPLMGMHRLLSCNECHMSSDFKQSEMNDCFSCHRAEDKHKGTLGKECVQCHTPTDWSLWSFDHDQQTNYPLKGAHEDLQCQLCHKEDQRVSLECGSCHREDDVHNGAFGQECQQCHNDTSFSSDKD